jgi:hypothetical protein
VARRRIPPQLLGWFSELARAGMVAELKSKRRTGAAIQRRMQKSTARS